MDKHVTTIFADTTLAQVPLFLRYLSGKRTEEVDELRVGGRFSRCERHQSVNYMNFPFHHPISNVDHSMLNPE